MLQPKNEMWAHLASMEFRMSIVSPVRFAMISQFFLLCSKMYDTVSVTKLPSATVPYVQRSCYVPPARH